MKYRKKPVIIEAVQWDESKATLANIGCKRVSCSGHLDRPDECTNLRIFTLEGVKPVSRGDYIIKAENGGFLCRKPGIFKMTYNHISSKQ
tara:strand:- start:737 stop:1006 length:270 start_codon:yes stop_codon:yes gene_type:complete